MDNNIWNWFSHWKYLHWLFHKKYLNSDQLSKTRTIMANMLKVDSDLVFNRLNKLYSYTTLLRFAINFLWNFFFFLLWLLLWAATRVYRTMTGYCLIAWSWNKINTRKTSCIQSNLFIIMIIFSIKYPQKHDIFRPHMWILVCLEWAQNFICSQHLWSSPTVHIKF